MTVPLGVLKAGRIRFQPPLPPRKQDAIARMGFGILNKVSRDVVFAQKLRRRMSGDDRSSC